MFSYLFAKIILISQENRNGPCSSLKKRWSRCGDFGNFKCRRMSLRDAHRIGEWAYERIYNRLYLYLVSKKNDLFNS
jgi:hypothetical protein